MLSCDFPLDQSEELNFLKWNAKMELILLKIYPRWWEFRSGLFPLFYLTPV